MIKIDYFLSIVYIIFSYTPKVFILENVKGLMTISNGNTLKLMMKKLHNLRLYNVRYAMLNTDDLGIPQSRPRLFIVGIY